MNLVSVTASAVVKIIIMTAVGFVAAKANILTKEASDGCTKVLVNVMVPFMIISSFFRQYDPELLKGMGISLLLFLVYAAAGVVIGLVAVKKNNPNLEVERVCLMYQNAGFIGLPIAEMLFGQVGVIYLAVHVACFNLFFFTHGIMVYTNRITKENFIKSLKSPVIPSIIIGLIIFLANIKLPAQISSPISSVGACATPLGMMISGGIIARSDIAATLKNKRVYLICGIKMIVLLLIVLVTAGLFRLEQTVGVCAVVMAACPTAAFDVMFAEIHKKNSAYASGMFGLTTIMCIVTIPLFVMLYGICIR